MMKSILYFGSLAICCLGSACSNSKTEISNAEHIIVVTNFEDKKYSIEEMGVKIEALILDPDALFSCITSIQLPSNQKYLYLSDDCTQNITIIDRNTGIIKDTKKMQGRGPGEYLDVGIMKIHHDTVIINDIRSNQSLRYDLNLKFIECKDMKSPQCIEYINVKNGLLGYNIAICDATPYRFYHKNDNFDLIQPYLELTDYSRQRSVSELGSRFTKNKREEVLLSHSFSNDIYEWQDGIRHKYFIDFGNRNNPPTRSIYGEELFDTDYLFLRNFFEVNNSLIFSFHTLKDKFIYHGFYDLESGSVIAGQVAPEHEILFFPRWQNGDELIGLTIMGLLPEDVKIINKARFTESSLDNSSIVVLFLTFTK